MFHKNARRSAGSGFSVLDAPQTQHPTQDSQQILSNPARLVLVASGGTGTPQTTSTSSSLIELVAISSHRCSSFLAEASVLVLVLALLDRFMAKGRIEMGWAAGAIAISMALLAASIVTDFTARRWLRAH